MKYLSLLLLYLITVNPAFAAQDCEMSVTNLLGALRAQGFIANPYFDHENGTIKISGDYYADRSLQINPSTNQDTREYNYEQNPDDETQCDFLQLKITIKKEFKKPTHAILSREECLELQEKYNVPVKKKYSLWYPFKKVAKPIVDDAYLYSQACDLAFVPEPEDYHQE